MLKKSYSKTGRRCRVTFKLTDVEAESAAVLGEFNAWDETSDPLVRRKDGSFSATLSLDSGRDYRFRYLLDAEVWTNDETADALVPNRFGGEDGVLRV
ncbi:MAG: isoamylase early set domain-containing protein [Acidobacteriota bacterium]